MGEERSTVLLVVEEPAVRELLADTLRGAGCYPLAAADAREATRLASQVRPDAVVLDFDGDEVRALAWWRENTGIHPLPTVLLTGSDGNACQRDESGCGADLCLVKPVHPRALVRDLLRLLRPGRATRRVPEAPTAQAEKPVHALRQASLQGAEGARAAPLRVGALEVDRHMPTLRLRWGGRAREAVLARVEHRLLVVLLSAPDRVHTRERLRAAVWADAPVSPRTVDQVVRRLRVALAELGCPGVVRTVPTVGYRVERSALTP